MEIKNAALVYFSATGNTKKVLKEFGSIFSIPVEEVDLFNSSEENICKIFSENDLVIFGVPSFGGRVPELAAERLEQIHGYKTPSVIITTYGNRDYDDTLYELREIISKNSFRVIAAAAVIAQHSIVNVFAKGRPNENDCAEIRDFANRVKEKFEELDDLNDTPEIQIKGSSNYKKRAKFGFVPKTGRQCINCRRCIKECPTEAINKLDPKHTNYSKCISCMHCTSICPTGARSLGRIKLSLAEKKLTPVCSEPKQNEYYL